MLLEPNECTQCGATDVTEFKAGAYVCLHCETVFRVAPKIASAGPLGCELYGCGVPAVGRCSDCGLPFCTTHQARNSRGPFFNLCVLCREQQAAEAAAEERRKRAERAAAVLEMVGAHSDALSRAAIVLRAVLSVKVTPTIGSSFSVGSHGGDVIEDVCPELLSKGRTIKGAGALTVPMELPWSERQIANWFCRNARNEGVAPDAEVSWWTCRRSLMGNLRAYEGRPEPAWKFPFGSSYKNCGINGDAYIFPDGRVWLHPGWINYFDRKAFFEAPGDCRSHIFTPAVLLRAAELLKWGDVLRV